ncbi:MAG: hypothetical protein ACRDVP_03000 [Acidimicrobiales bacterium]
MPFWKSSLIGLVLVAFALAVALGEMTAIGELVHAFNPAKHFDIYYALHQRIVVAGLVGVSLLWILALHPWAKGLVDPAQQDEPRHEAGGAGDPSPGNIAILSLHQERKAVRQQDVSQGVGG